MSDNVYCEPHAYTGIGSDIKWCGKWAGGKECLLCRHHATFNEWSQSWHWHYLLSWSSDYYYREYSHTRYSWAWPRWGKALPYPYRIKPVRYRTTGLTEHDIRLLLKRGCKKNKTCKCVSVAQRGSWYCHDCWSVLTSMTKYKHIDIHELILTNRNELKEEMLLLRLARIL